MLPVSAKLTAAIAVVYTVESPATRAVVRMVRAANNSGADKTFNVYIDTGAGNMQYSGKDQSVPTGYVGISTDEFELRPGHKILASCSVDGAVDLFISGHEIDQRGEVLRG